MKNKIQHRTTIVLPLDVEQKLTELCLLYHLSKSSVISLQIDKEHNNKNKELALLEEKRNKGYCEVID
jgi:hypothetical protein